MLAASCIRAAVCVRPQAVRTFSCCSVLAQKKTAAGGEQDIIQQLFVSKVREYAQKSKSGKVEVDPVAKATLDNDLRKFATQFGVPEGKEAEFVKFPSFSFNDSEEKLSLLGEDVSQLSELLIDQNIGPKETDPVMEESDPEIPWFER